MTTYGGLAIQHLSIEEFLTGERCASEPERVLVAVMFTDIVSSTERMPELRILESGLVREWRTLRFWYTLVVGLHRDRRGLVHMASAATT
jgi:hypothetical protein